MPEIRNVILDWSGTLVDDFTPVLDATNEIFRHYGKPPFSVEDFREKFFLPFPEFYKQHLPESTLTELDHHYHAAFKTLQTGVMPLPHSGEFLEYLLQRGMPVFLLSSIHHNHFEEQGGKLGWKKYFKQTYVQALDKRKVILHLLAEHELDASETIFIGDMVHDIETARHAGVLSCAVLTGYDSLRKLKAANPDLLFRNLREVRDFLERHRGAATHPPLPTVGALIFNAKDRVLMIQTHKWSHKWGIPGGKIKLNEPSEDALRREVLEETGLKLTDVRFEIVQDCIEPPEFYRKAHFLLLNYTARALGTHVVLNDEGEDHRWVTLDEAVQMDLNIPTRTLINHVRSHPRG
ncbi:MAG: HAD hydrolase-like protein [Methylacidiphilales bacterium]|nr:HAD hydrolase-like protein [Candidatus Methylacidiphilales bacterium]